MACNRHRSSRSYTTADFNGPPAGLLNAVAGPDPARIRLASAALQVLQQLKRDASGGLHEPDAEKEAAKLLQALGAHSDFKWIRPYSA